MLTLATWPLPPGCPVAFRLGRPHAARTVRLRRAASTQSSASQRRRCPPGSSGAGEGAGLGRSPRVLNLRTRSRWDRGCAPRGPGTHSGGLALSGCPGCCGGLEPRLSQGLGRFLCCGRVRAPLYRTGDRNAGLSPQLPCASLPPAHPRCSPAPPPDSITLGTVRAAGSRGARLGSRGQGPCWRGEPARDRDRARTQNKPLKPRSSRHSSRLNPQLLLPYLGMPTPRVPSVG